MGPITSGWTARGGERKSSDHIKITQKTDKPGIDIHIADGTVNEKTFIPVVITKSGIEDLVYNDFFIGENCDVTIIASCGIHNSAARIPSTTVFTPSTSVKTPRWPMWRHYGAGDGTGGRILNPQTIVYLEEGATIVMDTSQIGGVDSTKRYTRIVAEGAGSEVMITEKLMTHGDQTADSDVDIVLNGADSKARVISPQRGQGQLPARCSIPMWEGNGPCFGHVQCDSIIMGNGKSPVHPRHHRQPCGRQPDPRGRHRQDRLRPDPEAPDLGFTAEEAEEKILEGFLR